MISKECVSAQRLTVLGNALAHELKNFADDTCRADVSDKKCRELQELLSAWDDALGSFRKEIESNGKRKRGLPLNIISPQSLSAGD